MPSSVVAALLYNEAARTLDIVYRGNRGRYRYFGVPPDVYESFRAAPSKGTYLNEVFKEHGYRFEKLAGNRSAA